MKMPQKIQRVRHLLQGSIFLSSSLKNELLSALDQASVNDLEELEQMLLEGDKKQDDLLDKIIKHDTTFVQRAKRFRTSVVQKFQKKKEDAERRGENPDELLKKIR